MIYSEVLSGVERFVFVFTIPEVLQCRKLRKNAFKLVYVPTRQLHGRRADVFGAIVLDLYQLQIQTKCLLEPLAEPVEADEGV